MSFENGYPILKVENVSKRYMLGAVTGQTLKDALRERFAKKAGKKANETFLSLDQVSFEVQAGEAVGLIGSNGAGKSTLLKLISRITTPTTGSIYIDGKVASMLEVGTGFHPELTGRENIYLNGSILGMTRAEIDQKMDKIIEFSECQEFIDTPVKRYSSGMYVKLAFAVAAHLDSEIMIMDEVLAVGDEKFQIKCLNKMKEVAESENRTILYVSHNMNTIQKLCDRCLVLNHGRLIFDGSVEEAIRLYRGDDLRTDTFMNLKRFFRPGWLMRDDVRLLYVEYPEKIECVFAEESIRIRFKLEICKPSENIGLRIEFMKKQEKPFATSVLYNICSGDTGNIMEFEVEVPVENVMNGSYETFYTVFSVDAYGNSVDLDWVNGLNIVIKRQRKEQEVNWVNSSWGNIQLESMILRYVEEKSL